MKYEKYRNQTATISALTKTLLSVVFLVACNTNYGLAVTNEKRFDVAEKKDNSPNMRPGPKWKDERPRLLFTAERIKRLQGRIEKEKALQQAWLKLRERADRLRSVWINRLPVASFSLLSFSGMSYDIIL